VLDVTPTNAIIQKVNDLSAEKSNVSLQKCDNQLSEEVPWMGHGRTRRRRQIRNSNKWSVINQSEQSQTRNKPSNVTVTRSGRKIQLPASDFS